MCCQAVVKKGPNTGKACTRDFPYGFVMRKVIPSGGNYKGKVIETKLCFLHNDFFKRKGWIKVFDPDGKPVYVKAADGG